jgi:hypothetical protein
MRPFAVKNVLVVAPDADLKALLTSALEDGSWAIRHVANNREALKAARDKAFDRILTSDAVAWLPKEGILFTGDMCVNGLYNFVGDGDVGKWVVTLDMARKLGARIVCTGHGPRSNGTALEDQQSFFRALHSRDQEHHAHENRRIG